MTLKNYYSKSKHTRKENKLYNKIMREKYKKYKEAYHKAKIKFRTRTVDKYSLREFKEIYEYEYKSGNNTPLKTLTKEKNFSELTEYSYEQKRQNLKRNIDSYKAKQALGMILSPGELLVISVDPDGDIYKLVAYFDRLGLSHAAFDSPGV